jgi:hypothetical protein
MNYPDTDAPAITTNMSLLRPLETVLLKHNQDASAVFGVIASGDLVFVGGESCQDFGLLALRDLDGV